MRDIDELLPRVMEVVPTCPEPTVIRHLRDAAIEFCRRTRVWRDYDTFPLSSEACEVIAADSEAQIFEITHASVTVTDDEDEDAITVSDLEPKTVDWLDEENPGWRDETGTPRYFTQLAPNTVRVTPKPEDAAVLRLELVMVPSITAERFPDELIDTYGQVLADGALSRILILPTDFAQPQLAVAYAASFNMALGRWGSQVPRGQQRTPRRTKLSSFF